MLKELDKKIKTTRAQMQSASNDLKGHENKRQRLIMEKEAVIQELAALETQLASLETLINNLNVEVDEQKIKVNNIKNAHHEAESLLKFLYRKIKECDFEINCFYEEPHKFQHQTSESAIEKKTLENEVKRMETEHTDFSTRVDKLIENNSGIERKKTIVWKNWD